MNRAIAVWLAWIVLAAATPASAADRYALVVTGASGGEQYATKYSEWRQSLTSLLSTRFGYPADHIIALAERENSAEQLGPATSQGVEHALSELRRRVTRDDTLLIVLIGHGNVDGEEAKFNLVGPDLSTSQWAELVKPIAGTVVFVNTASASFPFLHKLAGPRRVVITANDSSAQQFETVFPEFFIKALTDPAADTDKNGRISIWEAFTYASAGVRQWFEQRAQLPTERPLLDDSGEGAGRDAQTAQTPGGPSAVLARATYLNREAPAQQAEGANSDLQRQKTDLEARIEALKARKGELSAEDYQAQLEKLLTDLARVSAALRNKS